MNQTTEDLILANLCHEIHTSVRRAFRYCRRQWDWNFRQNLYPIQTAKPLEFGVAYHMAMEVWYEPEYWAKPPTIREAQKALAVDTFVRECNRQRSAFLAQTGVEYLAEEVQQDYDERVHLGKNMLSYYMNDVSPRLDTNFIPVKVEIPFLVPIRDPRDSSKHLYCACDTCWAKFVAHHQDNRELQDAIFAGSFSPDNWTGLPVVYGGRVDMLAEDRHGNYWVFDWKTRTRIRDMDAHLYLDDQVGSYPWALNYVLKLPIQGFVYHEQKKAFPEPPTMNKHQRLGRWYSVSKQMNTEYHLYLQTIKEGDRGAYEDGCYDEFLTWLKEDGPVFYRRHQIHKSRDELAEIELNIGLEVLDMLDDNLRIYPSPSYFGCEYCAFRQPCLEKNARADYEYLLKTQYRVMEPYWVRSHPSTDIGAFEGV